MNMPVVRKLKDGVVDMFLLWKKFLLIMFQQQASQL